MPVLKIAQLRFSSLHRGERSAFRCPICRFVLLNGENWTLKVAGQSKNVLKKVYLKWKYNLSINCELGRNPQNYFLNLSRWLTKLMSRYSLFVNHVIYSGTYNLQRILKKVYKLKIISIVNKLGFFVIRLTIFALEELR